MKTSSFLRIVIIGILSSGFAQVSTHNLQPGQSKVVLQISMDPTPLATLGYLQAKEVFSQQLVTEVSLAVPIFLFDFKHYRLEFGAHQTVLRYGNWRVLSRTALTSTGTSTEMFDAYNFALAQSFLPGYYGRNWYLTGELGFTKYLATHLTHSQWYLNNVYSAAESGWYGSTGGKFDFGLQTGYTFKEKIGVSLRLGLNKTETFQNPFFVPIYIGVSTDVSF